jgi:hypothetical protein
LTPFTVSGGNVFDSLDNLVELIAALETLVG